MSFPLLTFQGEVCSVQVELEAALLRVLECELKLVSLPIQASLAECFVALCEWGDSRRLPELVTKLLDAAAKKGIDTGCRVYAPRTPSSPRPRALI